MVKQRQYAFVAALQKQFATAYFPWRWSRYDACHELFLNGFCTDRTLEPLYCHSIHFVAKWILCDQATTALLETLRICENKSEDGLYHYDKKLQLVRRADGDEGYPIDEASLEPDTVIVVKNEKREIQLASSTFGYVCGASPAEAIGKPSSHFWPGERGGDHIDHNDVQTLTRGRDLFHEPLKRGDLTLDRVSFRFLLPGPLQKFGRIAVICFDKAAGLNSPELKWPNRVQVISEKAPARKQDNSPEAPDLMRLAR